MSEDSVSGLLKLKNSGHGRRNVCYANSTICLLLAVPDFVDFLNSVQENFREERKNVPELILELLRLKDSKDRGEVDNLDNLRRLVNSTNSINWGTTGSQQDFVEFLGELLDTLWELVKTNDILNKIFHTTFNLVTRSFFKCTVCQKDEMRKDNEGRPIEDIVRPVSISIQNCTDVQEAWVRHRDENVPAGKKYCKNCRQENEVKKFDKVEEYPALLMIQLKRFNYGQKDGRGLNVLETIKVDESDETYHLVGAGIHRGDTLSSGHYVTVVRYENENWLINDDKVKSLAKESANKAFSEAYFLIYCKQMHCSPVKKKTRLVAGSQTRWPTGRELPKMVFEMLTLNKGYNLRKLDKESLKIIYNEMKKIGEPDSLAKSDLNQVKEKFLRECLIKKYQEIILTYIQDKELQRKVANYAGISLPKNRYNPAPTSEEYVGRAGESQGEQSCSRYDFFFLSYFDLGPPQVTPSGEPAESPDDLMVGSLRINIFSFYLWTI